MPSPILARADALMQRRRQGSVPLDDVPVLTDAVDLVDEIPLLEPATASDPSDAALAASASRAELASELARRVQEKLLAEIPHLVHVAVSELLDEYERKAQQEHTP